MCRPQTSTTRQGGWYDTVAESRPGVRVFGNPRGRSARATTGAGARAVGRAVRSNCVGDHLAHRARGQVSEQPADRVHPARGAGGVSPLLLVTARPPGTGRHKFCVGLALHTLIRSSSRESSDELLVARDVPPPPILAPSATASHPRLP